MKNVDTLLTNRYPDNGTGMVRKWYGNDSRNSRLDSLSIVSRESDLLTFMGRMAAIFLLCLTVGIGNVWGGQYTYNFADATKWYTTSAKTTNVSTGNTNNYDTFYDTNGVAWTASGASRYFSGTYFLLGKTGAYVVLPTYSGEKITSVVLHGSTGHSTSVSVNIYTTGGTAASSAQTWSTKNVDHTYNINSDYQASTLRIQVTNNYNTQFTSVTINTEPTGGGGSCNAIDVTGGSAVILPAGSTSYSGGDWEDAGAPTAYPGSTTEYSIGTGSYCVTLTKAADYSRNNNGLQFQASNGVLLIEDITSNSGVDVEIQISSGSGFSIALTGAETLTGQSSGTKTISTTSTSADLTISKTSSGVGYIKYIKVTPKAASCSNSVTVSDGSASTHGSITSITTSPVATCSSTAADRQVSIVVTPSNGYTAPENLSVGTKTGTVTSTKVSRTDNLNGTFTFVYRYNQNDNGSISYNAACVARTYTISLNDQTPTTAATPSSITATYDANTNLTGTVVTTLPTKTGYTFGGYYTSTGGSGVQLINSSGEIIASASGGGKTYTDASKNWVHAGGVTVYAKWTERALTNYRTTCSTCTAPTTVTASPVTGTTATINWSGGASDDGYTVVWSTSSTFPASLDGSNSHSVASNVSSYEITGLEEGETYYVWVVAECDDSQSDRISFTTPIEHTITFNYPDGFTFGGTSPLVVEDGETFTFPTISKPGSGYDCVTAFKGWVAGAEYIGQTTFISSGTTSEAVTEDATYTAVWVQEDGASEAGADDYELVTDEADLESGAKYLMVGYKSGTGYYAMGKQNTNNRPGVVVTVNDGLITGASVSVATAAGQDSKVYELTLGGSEGAWTFKDVSNQYLYASSGSSNYLKLNASIEAKGKTEWVISIEKDGHATIDTKYYTYDEDGAEDHHGSIFFNTGSTLFACYVKESENPRVYLFKKGGTVSHILTAAPNCDIRLSGDICVTSYKDRGIMAAEPLKVLVSGLTPSTGYVMLSSNSSDVYFSANRTPNFVKASKPTATLKIMADGSGKIDTDVYVHYKPSSVGTGAASEVVVTATPTGGLTATAQHLVHVRNMTEKFVIAAKLGTTWYALPADFSSSAITPEAVVIDVDENTMTATASKTAPKNCTYTLWPVKTTATEYDRYATNTAHYDGNAYGECIRPVTAVGHKGLWATGAASGAGIKNAVTITSLGAGTSTESENEQYEWRIYTTITDGKWTYNLQSNQANQIDKSRYLYLYKGDNVHWGTYNSGVSNELYFLPVTETEPFDMKVVEWYPTKMLIQTSNTLSGDLTVTIGGGDAIASVTYASKGSKLYEITIPGLSNAANAAKTMKVSYTAADKIYAACVKVPIIISRTNVDIVNGSSELNAPFSTITPAIYNTADLVVRDGATLKLNGTKMQNEFFEVTIYPTAKISVPEGKKISVHSLTFFGGIDEIYNGSTYDLNKYGVPELSLKGKCGRKTKNIVDYVMRVDLSQMYSLTVPYDVNLSGITYWDGTAMTPGTNLYISAYDGQARANKDMSHTWIWEANFESKGLEAKLKAGVGYTISAELQSGVGNTYSIIRMPMTGTFKKDETEAAKTVAVTAYDNNKGQTVSANHKGWNLVGNPYMVSISGDPQTGEGKASLEVGQLVPDQSEVPWNGKYVWEAGNTYRYVTVPFDDGSEYYQDKFSNVTLKPFKNFFIQVETSGDLAFALTTRKNAPARVLQVQEREVEFEIELANTDRQDHTGMLIADKYSPAYEINADLEKMENTMSVYTIYGGYKLAYNALSPEDARQPVPVGYIANVAGTYFFTLAEGGDVDEIEHIWLTDYELDQTVDLLTESYEFTTPQGRNETRFALNVELKETQGVTTNIDEIISESETDKPLKFIWHDKMYILRGGVIYDATGKFVKDINK